MLTIGKLGIGQERYYIDKVAEGAEDYYSGEGELPGEWIGDAARDLGLEGEVSPEQLTAMLTGRNPVDGEPLVGMNGVPAKGGVPGFDLTFSAPKSVSLLWGLGGPLAAQEVTAAHREAVGAALSYMQREACWTRPRGGAAAAPADTESPRPRPARREDARSRPRDEHRAVVEQHPRPTADCGAAVWRVGRGLGCNR